MVEVGEGGWAMGCTPRAAAWLRRLLQLQLEALLLALHLRGRGVPGLHDHVPSLITYAAGMRLLYTGDYSRIADRHMPAADLPELRPHVVRHRRPQAKLLYAATMALCSARGNDSRCSLCVAWLSSNPQPSHPGRWWWSLRMACRGTCPARSASPASCSASTRCGGRLPAGQWRCTVLQLQPRLP